MSQRELLRQGIGSDPSGYYRLLADAVSHFSSRGYDFLEVPWMVSKEAYYVTRPKNIVSDKSDIYVYTWDNYLVASGEQSFIQLMLEDKLPPGKYQCVTPCFRYEEKYDFKYKFPYFTKLELIDTNHKNCDRLLNDAKLFVQSYLHTNPTEVPTDIGTDLEIGGIEIGSYGIREYKQFSWAYGTGVALPRLARVLNECGL